MEIISSKQEEEFKATTFVVNILKLGVLELNSGGPKIPKYFSSP